MVKNLGVVARFIWFAVLLLISTVVWAESVQHVSISYAIPQLSGDPIEGVGTGFLFSRERGVVITAFHVIPNVYPNLKKGVLTVNGLPATLKCFWKEADIAFLAVDGELKNVEEMAINPQPAVGMQYQSGFASDYLMLMEMPHDAEERKMALGGSLQLHGTILQVSEAKLRLPNGERTPTGAWYLVTDTAAKQGFSGGPAVSGGKVIGIQQSVSRTGAYGALSSAWNIQKMMERPDCK